MSRHTALLFLRLPTSPPLCWDASPLNECLSVMGDPHPGVCEISCVLQQLAWMVYYSGADFLGLCRVEFQDSCANPPCSGRSLTNFTRQKVLGCVVSCLRVWNLVIILCCPGLGATLSCLPLTGSRLDFQYVSLLIYRFSYLDLCPSYINYFNSVLTTENLWVF